MKVLLVSSEMEPFAKTGGLADVVGALPKSIKALGHDVRVIIPKYKVSDKSKFKLVQIARDLQVKVGDKIEKAQVYETKIPKTDITVYLIGHDGYFGRDGLYQEKGVDYYDNDERFIFFSKAVLATMKFLGWEPHVMHCNDWQSALAITYIKTIHANDPFFNSIATVYTIHNIGYMGNFPADRMSLTGLGWEYFTPNALEFWGHVCFAKAGLVYADVINTVSETYAVEIQKEEFGYGLEGLIKARNVDVYGIVNGVDYDTWNPAKDKHLATKYSITNLRGKASNKAVLRKVSNLPQKKDVPIIGIVTRMADQKGFDILTEAMHKIMELPVQIVLLGTGEPKYEEAYRNFANQYPDKICANIGFDSAVAPLIYAGADMFLMPSKYEPCGLGQLISFKYGTVPVVRSTGGLADTVANYDPETEEKYNRPELERLGAYRNAEWLKKPMIWAEYNEAVK